MTTVVAIARGGSVAMAADTSTNVYERPIFDGARKIVPIRLDAEADLWALLGCAGDGATPGLLAAVLTWPRPFQYPTQGAWAVAMATTVTEELVRAGIVSEGRMDANLILAHAGTLWTLAHHQAIIHVDGVAAVGSGEAVAIGAMDAALALAPELANRELVRSAVSIAVQRDRYTRSPIQSVELTAEHQVVLDDG